MKYRQRPALSFSVQTIGLFGSNICLLLDFRFDGSNISQWNFWKPKKRHLKTIFHFCGGGVGEILTKSGFIFLCPDNWNRWLAQFIAINVISWRGAKNFKSEIYRFFAVWHVTFSKKQWPSIFKLIINETLKNRVILNIMQCEHFYKWLQLK